MINNIMRFFIIIGMIIFLGASSIAYAHKVTVFAWVDGDTVYTESKFASGRKAKNAPVEIYDKNGVKLLEGKTDENGEFSFQAPKKTEMKVVLLAGMGHKGEWKISVEEFQEEDPENSNITDNQDPIQIEKTETRNEVVADVMENVSKSPCLNKEEIQRLIDNAMDKKLKPIANGIQRLNNPDQDPTVTDIVGGLGYIIGLMGIASYFNYRKKKA